MPTYPNDVYSNIRTKVYLVRPGAWMQLLLVSEGVNVDNPNGEAVEVRERNEHLSQPILVKTGDTNITGSCTMKLADLVTASGDYSPKEFLTKIGRGASLSPFYATGKDNIEIRQVMSRDGKVETMRLYPCVISNVNFNPNGDNGIATLSFSYEAYMNQPVIVQGDLQPT